MTEATIAKLSVLLGADSTAYEKGIKKAKGGNQDLMASAKSMMTGVVAAFAAIGGAIKSAEVIIKSTQGTSDAFAAAMGGAKEATIALAQAIATNNFSDLITNFERAYKAGKAYSEALDDIADRTRSVNVLSKEAQLAIEIQKGIVSDPSKSTDEQKAALAEIRRITLEDFKRQQDLADLAYNAERDRLVNKFGLTKENADAVLDYVKNYQALTKTQYESIDNAVKAKAALDKYLGAVGAFEGSRQFKRLNEEYQKSLVGLTDQEKAYVELGSVTNRVMDQQRDQIARVIGEWYDAQKALQGYLNYADKHEGRLENKEGKSNAPGVIGFKDSESDIEDWMKTLWAQPPQPSVPAIDVVVEGLDILDEKFESTTSKAAQAYADMISDINRSTEQFIEGTIETIAAGLGEAFVTGQWDEFYKSILESFGRFAQQFGALLIAYGVAETAFKFSPEPVSKIAAGVALVAIGSAITAATKNPGVKTGGGSASVSHSTAGGYSSVDNSTRRVELVWKRAGKDLVAIMKEENFSGNSLTGK